MNAPARIATETDMLNAAIGDYRQSGVGRELGRNAVKDYTEEKTFHVHNGPRRGWWLPRGGGAGN